MKAVDYFVRIQISKIENPRLKVGRILQTVPVLTSALSRYDVNK